MLVERHEDKMVLKEVDKQKYMGVYIQNDGKNTATINEKINKAKINAISLINKLKEAKTGRFFVETLVILRESIFLSSLCYGVEVLHNLRPEEIAKLAKADEAFLRKALELNKSTSACLIMLELGLEPVNIKIMKKRMLYLKYILDHKDDLIYKIFKEQVDLPKKGDWWSEAKKDIDSLELNVDLKEIFNMSKSQWKTSVNEKSRKLAFKLLLEKRRTLKKGSNNTYRYFIMKRYLMSESRLTLVDMLTVLKIRLEVLDLPSDLPFKFKHVKLCRFQCQVIENITHTIECKNDKIFNKIVTTDDLREIIEDNVNKFKIHELMKMWKEREASLETGIS